jgi:hypothetical protein
LSLRNLIGATLAALWFERCSEALSYDFNWVIVRAEPTMPKALSLAIRAAIAAGRAVRGRQTKGTGPAARRNSRTV